MLEHAGKKGEFFQLQIWMAQQRVISAWGIQTGPFAFCSEIVPTLSLSYWGSGDWGGEPILVTHWA